MKNAITNVSNTVGLADVSEMDVEDITFVSHDLLVEGLEIASALQMERLEIGTYPDRESRDDDETGLLVLRSKRRMQAAIVIAPRIRKEDEDG